VKYLGIIGGEGALTIRPEEPFVIQHLLGCLQHPVEHPLVAQDDGPIAIGSTKQDDGAVRQGLFVGAAHPLVAALAPGR
jgi:hypothetical protein